MRMGELRDRRIAGLYCCSWRAVMIVPFARLRACLDDATAFRAWRCYKRKRLVSLLASDDRLAAAYPGDVFLALCSARWAMYIWHMPFRVACWVCGVPAYAPAAPTRPDPARARATRAIKKKKKKK